MLQNLKLQKILYTRWHIQKHIKSESLKRARNSYKQRPDILDIFNFTLLILIKIRQRCNFLLAMQTETRLVSRYTLAVRSKTNDPTASFYEIYLRYSVDSFDTCIYGVFCFGQPPVTSSKIHNSPTLLTLNTQDKNKRLKSTTFYL